MEAFVAAIKWLGMVHASEKLRTYNTVVGRILTTVSARDLHLKKKKKSEFFFLSQSLHQLL